tara:strand:+ start:791 stop:1606 length:816 start_codon:yes stop_codon:yes gene_type:complete
MKIINEINQDILDNDICLIPTMGALHKGHLSLIEKGKNLGLQTMVSIFVNEMQFNEKEDFKSYPRPIEEDIKILNNLHIDYLFIPENNYIYSKNSFEIIDSGDLGELYEGKSRPGHFDGVLTIVNRLFQLIDPKVAIFGKKDAQQLFLIKDMLLEKRYKAEIIEVKTVRENSGLALSSRNLLLTDNGKNKASLIYKILKEAKKEFSNNRELSSFEGFSSRYLNINFDYLEILDLETFSKPTKKTSEYIILAAALIEGVRLIDNIEFRMEKV